MHRPTKQARTDAPALTPERKDSLAAMNVGALEDKKEEGAPRPPVDRESLAQRFRALELEGPRIVQREQPRSRCASIAFFNHKGGVGKTTSCVAMGWKLAMEGYKVLIIDADPQCNATGFLVDPATELLAPDEAADPIEQFYNRFPQCNIYHSLAPLLGDHGDEMQRSVAVATEVFQVRDRAQFLPANTRPIGELPPETLFLLAGHPLFYDYDQRISSATTNQAAYPGAENVPGCFSGLLQELEQRHRFDFILVDFSPSGSVTNSLFIMSTDYLVVPCSPDYFSHMAIAAMTNMLSKWQRNASGWRRAQEQRERRPRYMLSERRPLFLGYTIQLFTIINGQPAQTFQRWIDQISATIAEDLVPRLAQNGLSLPLAAVREPLALIRNFQSVAPASVRLHLPAFVLTSQLCARAGNKSTHSSDTIVPAVRQTFSTFRDGIVAGVEIDITGPHSLQSAIQVLSGVPGFTISRLDQMTPAAVLQAAQTFENLARALPGNVPALAADPSGARASAPFRRVQLYSPVYMPILSNALRGDPLPGGLERPDVIALVHAIQVNRDAVLQLLAPLERQSVAQFEARLNNYLDGEIQNVFMSLYGLEIEAVRDEWLAALQG